MISLWMETLRMSQKYVVLKQKAKTKTSDMINICFVYNFFLQKVQKLVKTPKISQKPAVFVFCGPMFDTS